MLTRHNSIDEETLSQKQKQELELLQKFASLLGCDTSALSDDLKRTCKTLVAADGFVGPELQQRKISDDQHTWVFNIEIFNCMLSIESARKNIVRCSTEIAELQNELNDLAKEQEQTPAHPAGTAGLGGIPDQARLEKEQKLQVLKKQRSEIEKAMHEAARTMKKALATSGLSKAAYAACIGFLVTSLVVCVLASAQYAMMSQGADISAITDALRSVGLDTMLPEIMKDSGIVAAAALIAGAVSYGKVRFDATAAAKKAELLKLQQPDNWSHLNSIEKNLARAKAIKKVDGRTIHGALQDFADRHDEPLLSRLSNGVSGLFGKKKKDPSSAEIEVSNTNTNTKTTAT